MAGDIVRPQQQNCSGKTATRWSFTSHAWQKTHVYRCNDFPKKSCRAPILAQALATISLARLCTSVTMDVSCEWVKVRESSMV